MYAMFVMYLYIKCNKCACLYIHTCVEHTHIYIYNQGVLSRDSLAKIKYILNLTPVFVQFLELSHLEL